MKHNIGYFSTNASGALTSYYWSCLENEYVSLVEYDNGDCSGDPKNTTYYYQGCYYSQFTGFGYYLDVVDCANSIETDSPSKMPTAAPTYDISYVYIDGDEERECDNSDCTELERTWTTDVVYVIL